MPRLTGTITFIGKGNRRPYEPEAHEGFRFVPDGTVRPLTNETRWFHIYITSTKNRIEEYRKLAIYGDFSKKKSKEEFVFEIDPGPRGASFKKGSKVVIIDQLKDLFDWQTRCANELRAEVYWHEDLNNCGCREKNIQDYLPSKLRGAVYVVYSFNLLNYVSKGSRKLARKLFVEYGKDIQNSGSSIEYPGRDQNKSLIGKLDFSRSSIKLSADTTEKPADPANTEEEPISGDLTDITEREYSLIADGDKFSVFRGRLRRRWLVEKTYRLKIGEETPGDEKTAGDRISYDIRLSKTGLIEVRKKIVLRGEEKRDELGDVYEGLLRHRTISQFSPSPTDTKQLEGITNIVGQFAAAAIGKINESIKEQNQNLAQGTEKIPELEADTFYKDEEKKEIDKEFRTNRQKYVVIFLSDVVCASCGGHISPGAIHEKAPELILGLLQGSLVFDERSPRLHVPRAPLRINESIVDHSTWQDELCVFGAERSLIYFEPKTILEAPGSVANYEDYWKCVVRGIEHTISIRTSLQLIESDTQKFISRIPGLMEDIVAYKTDKKPTAGTADYKRIEKAILALAGDVAHAIDIIPRVRDVCVPSSVFRSGHSVEKFSYLNENCFRFPDILQNIQQNITELTGFLVFFKQQQLQMALDSETTAKGKQDTTLNTIVLIFTIATVYYVFPSFLQDFTEFWKNHCLWGEGCTAMDQKAVWGAGLYIVISFVLIIWATVFLVRGRPAREPRENETISPVEDPVANSGESG